MDCIIMMILRIPRFFNDGSKYGWIFKENDKYYTQINDKTYGPHDYVGYYPTFSNDSSKYGWWFEKGVKNTFKSTPKPMDHIIMLPLPSQKTTKHT
jgi:hypothetical protein